MLGGGDDDEFDDEITPLDKDGDKNMSFNNFEVLIESNGNPIASKNFYNNRDSG